MHSQTIHSPLEASAPHHRRQFSLIYLLGIVGVIAAAMIPLTHLGSSGLILAIWLVVVGTMLLHGVFYPAIVLIVFGVLCAPAYEERLIKLPQRPPTQSLVTTEMLFGALSVVALGIVLVAVVVWWRESTPVGANRVLSQILSQRLRNDDLKDTQLSIANIFGFSAAACFAMVPIFYLGFEAGSLISPFIVLTGTMIMYGKFRAALFSCLVYPVLWQLIF